MDKNEQHEHNPISGTNCPTASNSQISMSALLDAMVVQYGALIFEDVIHILRDQFKLTGGDPQLLEQVLVSLENCRIAIKQAFFLTHNRVSNPGILLEAISKSPQATFAPLRSDHLKSFQYGNIPEYSVHHRHFKEYLSEKFGFDPIAGQLLITDVMLQMNLDWDQNQVLQGLPESIRPKGEIDKKLMVRLLALVYQHTPRWLEKGYTPNELYVPSDESKRPEF